MKKIKKKKLVWLPFKKTYPERDAVVVKVAQLKRKFTDTDEEKLVSECLSDEFYRNNLYQVVVRHVESQGRKMAHLSIKRIDREIIRDWRHLQRIKNELVGEENEAVELYPAESRLVDTANQYHLWVLENPAERFPFGFDDGRVISEKSVCGEKQREFGT